MPTTAARLAVFEIDVTEMLCGEPLVPVMQHVSDTWHGV